MNDIKRLDDIKSVPDFESCIENDNFRNTADRQDIMQVNVGRLCNLACKHCHLECGPAREEIMPRSVMESALHVFKDQGFSTMDITGGAPEMNPDFRWFLEESAKIADKVIVRTNLAILTEEGYEDIPELFAKYGVEVFCSLPYYKEKNMEKQRGKGTFAPAIHAIKMLNDLGYGKGGDLVLNVVYNPLGAFLPSAQSNIESEFKEKLYKEFGIVFDNLFAIANNPIGRFGDFLERSGNLESYMETLYGALNQCAVENMMCRFQLSIGWDGRLYDCDFNQAIDMTIDSGETIFDLEGKPPRKRHIAFAKHCYACTAGQGSSCGGATA